jgi:WD40 repeat protein
MPYADGKPTPLKGHSWYGLGVAFSPDGGTLATACIKDVDGEIRLWDLAQRPPQARVWPVPKSPVSAVAFTRDGRTLLSTHPNDGVVRCWDVATGKETSQLRVHRESQTCGISMALAPDGKTVVTAAHRSYCEFQVWSVPEGRLLKKWACKVPERMSFTSQAYAPDGRTLASNSPYGDKVWLWDIESGKAQALKLIPEGYVGTEVAFSPDGKTLAVAYCPPDPRANPGKAQVRLWSVAALGRKSLSAP